MDKIIVRKDVLKLGYRCVNSSFINLTGGKNFRTIKTLLKNFDLKFLMKKLFNEDLESEDLLKTTLYHSYSELLKEKTGEGGWCKRNEEFIEMYKINEDFALQLDYNINLYHLIAKKEVYNNLVPWYYADSKMYLGDCWGETDKEIIENIQHLTVIQFLQRYKGYNGY